jgi:hypothetical protein
MAAVGRLVKLNVVISTVALGMGADKAYLNKLAQSGAGRAYYVNLGRNGSADGIKGVFLKELRQLEAKRKAAP